MLTQVQGKNGLCNAYQTCAACVLCTCVHNNISFSMTHRYAVLVAPLHRLARS